MLDVNLENLRGYDDVDFDFGVASDVAGKFAAAIATIEFQQLSRDRLVNQGQEQFQGAFAEGFKANAETAILDARELTEAFSFVCLRAEPLHCGAKASLFDTDGNRITAFLTNSPYYVIPELDRRHRARGRCENRIKSLKHTGLGKLPYWSFAANQAWALIAALASNLIAWLQLVVLPAGHEAGVWDVKRWWYRLFSMAGKLITSGRQIRLLIPRRAPESGLLRLIEQACRRLHQRWQHGQLTTYAVDIDLFDTS